jgi:hypothetical protein
MILLCPKKPVPKWWLVFPFPQRNVKSSAGSLPPLSHLTSCTPTKSNYTLLILLIPFSMNLTYRDSWHSKLQSHVHFPLLRPFQGILPIRTACVVFCNMLDSLRWVVSPHAQPTNLRTAPCRISATAYSIYSQLPSTSGDLLLHLQPENAPCRGDKGPT